MSAIRLVLAIAGCAACADASDLETQLGVNPIRKIVTLLQDMQAETEAEGKKEKELYDKFMCFCDGGAEDLAKTAADAKATVQQLTSKLDEMTSEKATLSQDIKQHTADEAAAEKDLAEASNIRENEAKEYEVEYSSKKGTDEALAKAIPAIEQGLGGASLMQVGGVRLVPMLKRAVQNAGTVLTTGNKKILLQFLNGNTPGSSEILGMLKSMKDEMSRTIDSMEKENDRSVKAFAGMKATKTKEIAFAHESIETKKERSGTLAVEIVQAKDGLEDASAEQADAEKFLSTLDQQCADKKKEWAERSKMRAEEVSAIGQAIAILNDDDALDVFKSTASASFIQKPKSFLQARAQSPVQEAESILAKAAKSGGSLDMLLFTVRSKLRLAAKGAVDFGEVVKMVDEMVEVLNRAQEDDAKQKDFCLAELTKSEAAQTSAQDNLGSLQSTGEELTDAISDAAQNIEDLTQSMAKLDKDVSEATEARKEDHVTYVQTLQLTETAVELVGKAKNRLQKFYNPSLYRAPPKKEMSMEDKIVASGTSALMQSELKFDSADDGSEPTSFVQKRARRVAPPEAPETFGEFKKNKKSGGVMALMDMLVNDLKANLAEAKFAEKAAQQDYVALMSASQSQREQDGKSLNTQEAGKADLKEKLMKTKESQHLTMQELENLQMTIQNLHRACDFIIKNFDYRAQARTAEIEGLKNAKAVLSGASFS